MHGQTSLLKDQGNVAGWQNEVAGQGADFGACKPYPMRAPEEGVRIPWNCTLLVGSSINPMVLKSIICLGAESFRVGEIFLPSVCSVVRVAEL